MAASDEIYDALQSRNIKVTGEVVVNPGVENSYFIPVRMTRGTSGRQDPSHKDLAHVRQSLSTRGISVEFLLVDETAKLMEEGLRGSLISTFPELVRNAFLSMEEGKAIAWVENKRELETNDRDRITAQIKKFAELYPVRAVHVNFTADAILATNFEILAVVRRYAPIGCEDLRDRLLARDFSVPSLDWINRKFDTLRKTGLLIRRPDRTYALTADALHRLGTRKNRHSPDIGRLLALARRGR